MKSVASSDNVELMGKPCVGCGFCCSQAPCWVSARIHGPAVRKCPELRWNGDRYVCRLMTLDGDQGAGYREELHAGAGCCSGLNSWRSDVRDRMLSAVGVEHRSNPFSSEFQAFLKCLGREFVGGDALALTAMGFQDELVRMGYEEEKASEMASLALHYMKQNRTSMVEGFLG